MLKFTQWLFHENQAAQVTIDTSRYEKIMKTAIEQLSQHAQQEADRLAQFKFDPSLLQNSTYPQKQELLAAIQNHRPENDDDLYQHITNFNNWYLANRKLDIRPIWRHVLDQHSILQGNWQHDPQYYVEALRKLVAGTEQNMEVIKQKVLTAIQNIPQWAGSPVKIVAEPGETSSGYEFEPATSCEIYVGSRGMFSYFEDEGKVIIDDVIEGGEEDEEFFDNSQTKGDYYALINELRKPGANAKGKLLTLYTARPSKDRDFYSQTTWLPINIFLTNRADHAEGLAHDLGSNEIRDVWMVKIDSRYLVQTLDGPVKYYMIAQEKAPIKSISLY